MTDLHKHIAALSPEKRKLLEALLQKEAKIDITQSLIVPLKRDTNVLPVSFAQQRLWLLDQLYPGNPFYNIPLAMHLAGHLDQAVLHSSINAIVQRHETLRTNFTVIDGQPMQVVAPSLELPLPLIDLHHLPAAEREVERERVMLEEAAHQFNLQHGPLLRTTLVRLDPQEHLLLVTIHHIVADGWSTAIFMRELGALYEAAVSGRAAPLAELPVQYADFAAWQREWLKEDKIQQQLAYWQRQLANVPMLELPTDHLPSPAQTFTFRGSRQNFTIAPAFTAALKALSQREGTTLFVVLLAAFQVILQRYSGQHDIAVGTPIAGRKRDELEGLIGSFNNMLVLRTALNGNPSFRELLQRAHKVAFDAYEHQDVPFEKLVEVLQPERSLNRSPLFQVLFVLQNVPMPQIDLPSLRIRELETHSGTARYDLSLAFRDTSQGLTARLHYNTDLFDESTIERLIAHYLLALEQVVADPAQQVGNVRLVTEAERQHLLVAFNATTRPYPSDRCIHQFVAEQAQRTPDAVAVVFEDQALSYRDLDERANQLAHRLRELEVGPERCVAIALERSIELVVALLGVLKAGGAYVPLDPDYPQARLQFMLEQAQVAAVLTQAAVRDRLPSIAAPMLCLDTLDMAALPSTPPVVDLTPDHLAYVIYTSGSTGQPKGVQISHRALINLLHSMRQEPGLVAADTLLAVTTLSFDIAGLELFLPLLVGARVVLARRDQAVDCQALAALVETSGATVMQATPAGWQLLLASGWTPSPSFKMLCGGEALPLDLAQRLLARGGTLWNMYGPTETTIWSMAGQVPSAATRINIGRPIANTEIYLLDQQYQPVPIDVVGEIYIGGAGLSRGYLHQPELTAEKFVPDPFGEAPGARLYRTGDLARYRPDDTIEFLGRVDQQVKLRGFRIDLGEIEAALDQHPAVQQAVVVTHADASNQRLVAYVVENKEPVGARRAVPGTGEQPKLDAHELRAFLRDRLPEYMLPAVFMLLDALPLTPNGKVDRAALPVPDSAQTQMETSFVAPRTVVEEALANLWASVLDLERVGAEDNFFDHGGHSLKAALLLSRVRETFQAQVPLQSMFRAPTVAAMAELLIANEAQPGQIVKIAQMLKRIRGTSHEELRKLLEQKRRERNNG